MPQHISTHYDISETDNTRYSDARDKYATKKDGTKIEDIVEYRTKTGGDYEYDQIINYEEAIKLAEQKTISAETNKFDVRIENNDDNNETSTYEGDYEDADYEDEDQYPDYGEEDNEEESSEDYENEDYEAEERKIKSFRSKSKALGSPGAKRINQTPKVPKKKVAPKKISSTTRSSLGKKKSYDPNHDGYYDDRLPAILDEVTKTSHIDVILKIALSIVVIAALITYCIFYVNV